MAINFPNNPAVNDTFTVGGTKFTFTGDKWESGAVVELSSDTTPQLSGELNAGSHNINNAGVITATAFHGDGSNLTGVTDAAANTYGNSTAVPQIVVGANGRITGISNVSISGGGGGGGTSIILKDSQSLVGAAGTIDFGTGLSVSAISAGVATVTGITTSDVRTNTLSVSGVSTFTGTINASSATLTGNLNIPASGTIQRNGITWIQSGSDVTHYAGSPGSSGGDTIFKSYFHSISGSAEIFRIGYGNGGNGAISIPNGTLSVGGISTFSNNLHVGTGITMYASSGIVSATSFSGDGSNLTNVGGSIPSGGIIIWSGASNAIPTGWVLCDGQNSTPDLRDRFVIGAGNNYAVDATGGSADAIVVSHTHGSGNLQTNNTGGHSHGGNTNDSGNHSHGGGNYITNTTGSHQHRWGTDDSDGASGAGNPDANGGQSWKAWTDSQGDHYHNVNGNSQSEGNHSHNINTNNDGSHQHNMNGDTGSQGSSGTGANLPPYYALCYIMKS
tara:strand:- start:7 stop:1515 length:1509 start_codon:yes stop_codon:yes gene_type:complete